MLRTLAQPQADKLTYRLAGIVVFTLMTILAARVTIYFGSPVPFTLQVLAVLVSGMVLGMRDGAMSQLAYLGLIALNLPVDANGVGAAALFGPTGGYLIGFVMAAGVAGFLVERGQKWLWQRWLAGVAGIAVIYLFGVVVLKGVTGMNWDGAWTAGAVPFVLPDLAKALIAASLTEGGRTLLQRRLS